MFKTNFTKALTTTAVCLLSAIYSSALPHNPAIEKTVAQQKQTPLLFTENSGQVADAKGRLRPDILFTAHSGTTGLYLTANGIHYQFTNIHGGNSKEDLKTHSEQLHSRKKSTTETYRFSLTLAGANLHSRVRKEQENVLTENFYLGHCPNGITGVHTYAKVTYEKIYPGIDWVVYSSNSSLKYDFIVHPDGDPSQIKLKIDDAESVSINESGELMMKTSLGEVREKAPVSFTDGKEIKTSFKRNGDGTIGFNVIQQPGKELVIDPTVNWATYYGGSASDVGSGNMGLKTDGLGNVYITGNTSSTLGIATSSGHQTASGGGSDAFIAKFDASGTRIWATYYGGTGGETGYNCAIDGSGNLYAAGTTTSTTAIATTGAYQPAIASTLTDGYLVKFNSAGIRLWGTYYGGAEGETSINCSTDLNNNVYLSGVTLSTSGIASAGAYQTTYGGNGVYGSGDAFLAKFDDAGTRQWATYYGGNDRDEAFATTTDANGNIYMVGVTASTNQIASSGAHQATFGGAAGTTDGFMVKFSSAGSKLWGTYYGGTGASDFIRGCALDNTGNNIYIAGTTNSTNGISTSGTHQPVAGGGYDAFLAKFNSSGVRQWGTYYGGSGNDAQSASNCSFDTVTHFAFLTGNTLSTNGIASGGFQNTLAGGIDAFIAKFDTTGARIWGSYYGGTGTDYGYTCQSDGLGSIYMAGQTNSTSGISTSGSHQASIGGTNDLFLIKIADVAIFTDTTLSGNPFCAGANVNVPFTIVGVYNTGNVFTAQLSNATGSFANPINIGLTNGTTAGTINAIIPANTPSGTGYRIRVVGSNPVIIGKDNMVDLTINAKVNPSVTVTANPGNTICANTSMTFTATPVNGGIVPSYQWQKNGINVGANAATYNDNALASGDQIKVILTSTAACPEPDTAVSNNLIITVNPILTPSVTVTANPGNTICAGTQVTFTAIPVNGGTAPSYQWKKNGINTGINAATYTDNTLINGDVITVTLTSNALCATPATATSTAITMIVNPVTVPSVSIAQNTGTTICSGTSVTFSATAVNGGTTPIYQWKKNGITVGTNAPTYTDNLLTNGDVITVTLTSNAACAIPATVVSNAITMTVNTVLTPAISITQSTSATICASTSITFTAMPVNGGTTPSYRWQKNGIDIPGAIGNTHTAASWTTGDQINAILTSSASCAMPSSATSNMITLTVTPAPAMPGTITGSSSICAATANVYSIATVPSATSYLWTLPAGWLGSSTTNSITVTSGSNNGIISVAAINLCGTSANQDLAINVNSVPVAPGTISGPQTPCVGASVSYNISPVSSATGYNWTLPGAWTGASVTNTINATAGSGNGNIIITAVNACGSSLPATLSVAPVGIPAQPSVITGNASPCAGSSQTYSVLPVSGLTYNWSAPAGWNGNSTTNSIIYTTGATSGMIAVTANGACGTSVASTRSITVNPVLTPSVSINSPGSICANALATFSAIPVNGGSSPDFQWIKNGLNVGLNTNTYTDNNLNTGDIISAIMTTNASCVSTTTAASNPIIITVTPSVVPGININATTPLQICAGTSVTFFSNIVGGGNTPVYTWRKNGIVKGTNSSTYIDNTLQTGDTIDVVLTSNAACASVTTVLSNKLGMTIATPSTPSVIITASPGTIITPGQMVTFSATAINSGVNPTYQWLKNNQGVAGANSADWTTDNVASGDLITVQVTSSLPCAYPVQATSNSLAIRATGTGIPQRAGGEASINLYPNPNSGHFTLEVNSSLIPDGKRVYVLIVNNLGQTIYSTAVIPDANKWSLNVVLGDEVANGIYTIRVNNTQFESVKRFEIKR